MPLQIADPQDELSDCDRARVRLDAAELVWVHRQPRTRQSWDLAETGEQVQHLAFKPLQMLQSDIKEIAGAAGRVEDRDRAEVFVKAA